MNIIESLKEAARIAAEMGQADLSKKIAEIQQPALEMVRENQRLKQYVGDLQQRLKHTSTLLFEKNCYWHDLGARKDGPFCSVCWDSNGRLIRPHKLYGSHYQCQVCKSSWDL
jgi:hypothetical protein